MKTLKLLKKLVTGLIIMLMSTHFILSFFFYKKIMFRTELPLTLDLAVIGALLVLGYIKYRLGDTLPRGVNLTSILAFTIVALLVFILMTRNVHRRQVEALTKLIIRLEK